MPKKTTILIVILAIITGVLIYLAVRADRIQLPDENREAQTPPSPVQVTPFATLSFPTLILDASKSQTTQKVDILIDTKGKPVSGTQIELSYDPKVLTNVSLTPPAQNPFFGTNPVLLINSVDKTQGRISYAIGISTSDDEKTGQGSVVTLSFTVNKFAGVPVTQISFLQKSAITTLASQNSVLASSSPLQIIVLSTATGSPAATSSATY
jgi:hypothetical protein